MFGKKSGSEGAIRRPNPISLFHLNWQGQINFLHGDRSTLCFNEADLER